MARIVLTTPGEDVFVGGTDVEVIGTASGGEVITLNPSAPGDYTLDATFSQGGDTIVLPGNAADYTARIAGSRVVLTGSNGVVVSIPVGGVANTLSFDGDDDRQIVVVDGEVQIGDQVLEPGVDNDLGEGAGGGEVTLTAGVDVVSGSVFNAPRVFNPGGTDQVNSLNDDDVLTGTGERNVLNFTFVNDSDTGDRNIAATLNNIQEINVDVRADAGTFFTPDPTLDLQDATGVEEVNVSGIDDFVNFTVDNIQAQDGENGTWDLSVSDSNADNGSVSFLFDEDAIDGDDDVVNLTLDDAELEYIEIEHEDGDAGLGIETLNILSLGENELEYLDIEDVEAITIAGEGDLTLGGREEIVRSGGSGQVEAFYYYGGLENVAGSLLSIDASEMTGDLDLVIGDEISASWDETSGGDVDLEVIGGSGNDTFRLVGVPDSANDVIDGGEGDDFLYVNNSVTSGTISNLEALDIRGGHDLFGGATDFIEIDADVFDALETIWIRNEGNNGSSTTDVDLTVELNNLTAAQALDINLQHGTTGNNGLDALTVVANLADTTGVNVVGVTWDDQLDDENRGINNDPRFNFTLVSAAESVTLTDNDSESNSVLLGSAATITGAVTLEGGRAGQFLSLDVFDTDLALPIDEDSAINLYGKVVDGTAADLGTASVDGAVSGHIYQAETALTTRLVAATIDASAYLGDAIVRVGAANQTITMGFGNDTVVFDARGSSNAGLTVADTLNGGAGNDTIAFEGNQQVTIGGSEWLNVRAFETIVLIGNEVAGGDNDGDGFVNEFGENAYNIRLTTELLNQNGTVSAGGIRTIHIRNDNDLAGPNDVGGNTGVTIDATPLTSGMAFSYDGAENANSTADRFIMSDININGRAVIDGGAATTGTGNGNLDILEVRATQTGLGAQITDDDLVGIRNVSTLEFVNNTANDVTHFLELNNALIDQLVNTEVVVGAEVLVVRVFDNPDLPAAETTLVVDLTGFVGGGDEGIAFEGDGSIEIVGFASQADAEAAGLDFSAFTGDAVFEGGDTLVQDYDATSADDAVDFGADLVTDSITFDAATDGVITVTGFISGQDDIIIDGALATAIDESGFLNPLSAFTTSGTPNVAQNVDLSPFGGLGQPEVLVLSAGDNTTLSLPSYANLNLVAAQLELEINLTEDAGDDALIIVQGTDGSSALYNYTGDGDDLFEAGELSLLATFDTTIQFSDLTFA